MMNKPSVKQLHAIHLLSQGYSKRQALIRAGYSVSTANQASRVLHTQSMMRLVESFQDKLIKAGITPDYVVGKLAGWLEAKKIVNGQEVPAYNTQLQAFSIIFTLLKQAEEKEIRKPKNMISITDWVNSD